MGYSKIAFNAPTRERQERKELNMNILRGLTFIVIKIVKIIMAIIYAAFMLLVAFFALLLGMPKEAKRAGVCAALALSTIF